MPDSKTYWAIINDEPTECIMEENFYDGTCIVRPVDPPDARSLTLLRTFVHEDKKACIHHAQEILARHYSEGERSIKNCMMLQAQLFHKIEALQKALEECDAEG